MTARPPPGADPLVDATAHCAGLARAHARDQWLGALYAGANARGALFALASFDYEIRHALKRARDPNLMAIRLTWWREVISGERQAEAAGNPVALTLRAAIDAYALPRAWLEAMLDARLQEIAPQDDFNLVAFRAFADESEGARLRLASRIAAGGRDLDPADAQAPAGVALALTRLLKEMSGQTQFIVITHAKRTMEAAQSLYGVTMQEPGVSKLVSVRFEQDAPPPRPAEQLAMQGAAN